MVFQGQIVVYLMDEHDFTPVELGVFAGIPNILFYISLIGLLIKIRFYKNRSDFLNS